MSQLNCSNKFPPGCSVTTSLVCSAFFCVAPGIVTIASAISPIAASGQIVSVATVAPCAFAFSQSETRLAVFPDPDPTIRRSPA